MKRDMDLIRLLLMRTEGDEDAAKRVEEFPVPERAYHAALLKDAGFIEAVISRDQHGLPHAARITRLTWEGHEFLDAMRDDTIWKKAKEKMLKPGISWTVSILFDFLKTEAKQRLFGAAALPTDLSP